VRDPAARFADRVDDYVRHRPGYPRRSSPSFGRGAAGPRAGRGRRRLGHGQADGTAAGGRGPGARGGAERRHARRRGAPARPGARLRQHRRQGEATGISDASVDLVTAAQAFHWFDRAAARAEFLRILRPRGTVALVWNERDGTGRRSSGTMRTASGGSPSITPRSTTGTPRRGSTSWNFSALRGSTRRSSEPAGPRPRRPAGPVPLLLLRAQARAPALRRGDEGAVGNLPQLRAGRQGPRRLPDAGVPRAARVRRPAHQMRCCSTSTASWSRASVRTASSCGLLP